MRYGSWIVGPASRVIVWTLSHAAPTTKRIASMMLAAAFLSTVLSFTTAGPAAAYRLYGERWQYSTFYVCIREDSAGGFTSYTRRDNIFDWVEKWEIYSSNLFIYRYDALADDCSGAANVDIIIGQGTLGPPAQTLHNVSGGYLVKAFVTINGGLIDNDRIWWQDADQGCHVLVTDCKLDAKTIFRHEMGHALGIAHNLPDTSEYRIQRCEPTYYSTDTTGACLSAGRKMMHWNAGVEYVDSGDPQEPHQGYRHGYTYDDKEAVRALFGD